MTPWLVDALRDAPLDELPKALRRMSATLAPWPTASESAIAALQQWVPGMLREVTAQSSQASVSPAWIVDAIKAVTDVNAVTSGEFPDVCQGVAEALSAHKVWIAGILVAPPQDQSERARLIGQWLREKLAQEPSHVQYMPGRRFLVCQASRAHRFH